MAFLIKQQNLTAGLEKLHGLSLQGKRHRQFLIRAYSFLSQSKSDKERLIDIKKDVAKIISSKWLILNEIISFEV